MSLNCFFCATNSPNLRVTKQSSESCKKLEAWNMTDMIIPITVMCLIGAWFHIDRQILSNCCSFGQLIKKQIQCEIPWSKGQHDATANCLLSPHESYSLDLFHSRLLQEDEPSQRSTDLSSGRTFSAHMVSRYHSQPQRTVERCETWRGCCSVLFTSCSSLWTHTCGVIVVFVP